MKDEPADFFIDVGERNSAIECNATGLVRERFGHPAAALRGGGGGGGEWCLLGFEVNVRWLCVQSDSHSMKLTLQDFDLLVVLGCVEHQQDQILQGPTAP